MAAALPHLVADLSLVEGMKTHGFSQVNFVNVVIGWTLVPEGCNSGMASPEASSASVFGIADACWAIIDLSTKREKR